DDRGPIRAGRASGRRLSRFRGDVLDRESRASIVIELSEVIGSPGRMRVRLHSIAFGNLKRVPERRVTSPELAPPRNRARPGGTSPWQESICLCSGHEYPDAF